ncbi:DNA polymerase III subunit beta [Candidatus Parcubacteria bacterium]|nr:DNA polymerase III subunit beta [Patescibacteria group bacterium]MBU4466665.1 DNA polymerase III subunit beta [Patescibacteria group bacterium]MCG2688038.1 DNA polymerase III subunit beta [Candidatus Parcubacteria bacterium]
MKVTILKEKLKEGLSAVSRIAQKNLSLPILSSVLISSEKNFICLKATDLEMGIKWWALSKTEKDGEIACPLRIFQGLIDGLVSEKILLNLMDKKILLEADNFNAEINGLDAAEFPIIPELDIKTSFNIQAHLLSQGLSQVVEMTATSSVQPEISGVYFNLSGNQLKMAATDSFRLAEKIITLTEKVEEEISFILPQKACKEIVNLFNEKEETLKISLSSNQILLELPMAETSHPKVQFFSRLIEGEYPNYQEIIPQKFDFKSLISRNLFLQNLKTTSLFSNRINEVKIRINQHDQKIELEGQNLDIGQSISILTAEIEGNGEMGVSFDWRFLMDGLAQIKTKDLIFSINKDEGPAVLRPRDDSSYLYLLMPLRT